MFVLDLPNPDDYCAELILCPRFKFDQSARSLRPWLNESSLSSGTTVFVELRIKCVFGYRPVLASRNNVFRIDLNTGVKHTLLYKIPRVHCEQQMLLMCSASSHFAGVVIGMNEKQLLFQTSTEMDWLGHTAADGELKAFSLNRRTVR